MKKLLLLLLVFLSVASATTPVQVTLVGLSGSERSFEAYEEKDSTLLVAPLDIWQMLYLNKAERGDTLLCEFDGRHLYFLNKQSYALIDSTKYPLDQPLVKKAKKKLVTADDFAALMTTLCQTLTFTYTSSNLRLTVTKTPPKVEENGAKQSTETTQQFPASEKPALDSSTVEPKGEPVLVVESVDVVEDPIYKRLTWPELTGVVVLDPGHGGKDPGAVGPSGTQEKEVVLAIAEHAKSFIERNSKVKALLTRDDDTFVPLRGRTKYANDKGAALFVSIHANATEDGKARGFKMYFLSEAKNESDQRTAMLENAVMELEEEVETDFLTSILLDMMSSEYLKESQDLSIELAETFAKRLETRRLHTGVGQANFYVLRGASMPAVLVETAFISNATEEKVLADKKYQRKAGDAIGRAILDFIQEVGPLYE